jgi:hypothetical protein
MTKKLAVMFIHGVEINNPQYADNAISLLRREFARCSGVDPDTALVVRPTFYAPVLDASHDQLLRRVGGGGATEYFRLLSRWATRTDGGRVWPMMALALSGLIRQLPWAMAFHFPTLRWVAVHYLGDLVAYQVNTSDRTLYDKVHAVLAGTLEELAEEAGDDAPLCVVAHSLGTVVASNFFYDLEVASGCYGAPRNLVGLETGERLGHSPLARGETLSFLYTLGSPMALWAGRLPDYGTPLFVPHPRMARHHPHLAGEWINYLDPDDLVATPLRKLNSRYEKQVHEDRTISVGPWWLGWTPLSHPWYWNDRRVIGQIAATLARAWHVLDGTRP